MEDTLFEQIISLENLFATWREFRRGKRGRRDVQEFERHLEDNIFSLHDDLANGRYHHGPYHRFHIFDPKHRIIHKARSRLSIRQAQGVAGLLQEIVSSYETQNSIGGGVVT